MAALCELEARRYKTADPRLAGSVGFQLSVAATELRRRINTGLMLSGVTMIDPATTYIESGVAIGQDSVIQPFTFIGRDSTIGANCVIGPFARIPRDSIVPEGTSFIGHPTQEAGLKI